MLNELQLALLQSLLIVFYLRTGLFLNRQLPRAICLFSHLSEIVPRTAFLVTSCQVVFVFLGRIRNDAETFLAERFLTKHGRLDLAVTVAGGVPAVYSLQYFVIIYLQKILLLSWHLEDIILTLVVVLFSIFIYRVLGKSQISLETLKLSLLVSLIVLSCLGLSD